MIEHTDGIPWGLAERIAGRVAGSYGLADGYHGAVLADTAPEIVRRASALVEEDTGLSGGGDPEVAVVGRAVWVERNLSFFAEILKPAEEKLEKSLAEAGTTGGLSKRFMAAEMGCAARCAVAAGSRTVRAHPPLRRTRRRCVPRCPQHPRPGT